MRLGTWAIYSSCERAIEAHFVALMVAHTVGQSVVMNFYSVVGQLQVLAGIFVDVV
jgi:hypothetical protein